MKLTTERRTNIMKAAHILTKVVINHATSKDVNDVNYSATFALSLKEIYAEYKTCESNIARWIKDGTSEEKISTRIATNIFRAFQVNFEKAEYQARLVVREMHYSEYKNDYQAFVTVKDSYNKETKTIKVYTNLAIGNVLITDPAQEAYYKNYYKSQRH